MTSWLRLIPKAVFPLKRSEPLPSDTHCSQCKVPLRDDDTFIALDTGRAPAPLTAWCGPCARKGSQDAGGISPGERHRHFP